MLTPRNIIINCEVSHLGLIDTPYIIGNQKTKAAISANTAPIDRT